MRRPSIIVIAALAAYGTRSAPAQQAPQPSAAPAPAPPARVLQPPRLLVAQEPVYPASKAGSGENATVALVLTLDVKGDVTQAVVATSAGDEFDQAALDAARKTRFEPALENGIAGLPFRCWDAGEGRDLRLDEFSIGVKRIMLRERERNQNPVIQSITFDGAPWPADEVKDVGSCDRADFSYDSCPSADKHELAAVVTPDSFEAGSDEFELDFEEQVLVQYYATEGIFEDEVRLARKPTNGWVARRGASGQAVRLWFVVRDSRGGVAWTERQVRVR